jgi:hypothetical protein
MVAKQVSIASQDRAAGTHFVTNGSHDFQGPAIGHNQLGSRTELDHSKHFTSIEQIPGTYPAYNAASELARNLSNSKDPGVGFRVRQNHIQILILFRRLGAERVEEFPWFVSHGDDTPG